jgi:hypothetical protein
MPAPNEFLTVAEIASILRLNQQTIRNWFDAGRRVRVSRTDFDAFMAGLSPSVLRSSRLRRSGDGEIPSPLTP